MIRSDEDVLEEVSSGAFRLKSSMAVVPFDAVPCVELPQVRAVSGGCASGTTTPSNPSNLSRFSRTGWQCWGVKEAGSEPEGR